MPGSLIKSFAEKSGKTVTAVEKIWDETKKEAKDKFKHESPRFWAYVNATVQYKLGLKEKIEEAQWVTVPDKPAKDLKRGDKVIIRQGERTFGATYLQTQYGKNGKAQHGHPKGHLVKLSDAYMKIHPEILTALKWFPEEDVFREMADYGHKKRVEEKKTDNNRITFKEFITEIIKQV